MCVSEEKYGKTRKSSPTPDSKKKKVEVEEKGIQFWDDSERVKFPAVFVSGGKRSYDQRRVVAEHAMMWIKSQKEMGVKGCVIFDIDDTLINGREAVTGGFEFMVHMYNMTQQLYPIHIVTARPDEDHSKCMDLLYSRGIQIPTDRLHMLPSKDYFSGDTRLVEKFKWKCYVDCHILHKGVVARFGDKLWDVAHINSLRGYLRHVEDKHCYIFFDPDMKNTLSGKLPGTG